MIMKTCSLMKYLSHLSGIANVLETMELSFKGARDAQLDDIHCLLENVLRVKQVLIQTLLIFFSLSYVIILRVKICILHMRETFLPYFML